jgi:hypothetical protein
VKSIGEGLENFIHFSCIFSIGFKPNLGKKNFLNFLPEKWPKIYFIKI